MNRPNYSSWLGVLVVLLFGLPAKNIRAQEAVWITPPELPAEVPVNQWYAFKHRFTVDSQPDRSLTTIAVDSKYWLYINDSLVVREGNLKRGPYRDATYADTIDLAPWLKPGENTIALLVWYFGKDGFSHASSGQPGLYAKGPHVRTDNTWRVIQHPAYGQTGPPHPNYRLPEQNIQFDARRDIRQWHTSDFREADWPEAIAAGQPPTLPWGKLVTRPIPQWKDFGRKPYPAAPAFPKTVERDTTIRLALPYNAQINPVFRIRAPRAGDTIRLQTDNYRGGSAPNVRAEYITRSGEQTFEMPAWINGHEMWYAFPEGTQILDLAYRETGYATSFPGSFSCSKPFYDTLWQKAVRTLYITLRDTYMDCPDRERAQWWGDVVLELGESFYATDRRTDHLTAKAIRELLAWQRSDSTIYSPVPSGNWNQELPMQMLASVGYYGAWTYFTHSGDTSVIRDVYPAIQRYLGVWKTDAKGLAIPRQGGWTWGDWGEQKDMRLLYNGWYMLALKGLREMATLHGEQKRADSIDLKMDRLRTAFREQFWNGYAFRDPAYQGATDDRAQALAVVSGIATTDQYPFLRKLFKTQRYASPYMEKYVLEALCQMGYAQDALTRMQQRFEPMVSSPLTTLWEGWGIGAEGFGGGTYNHAWSGGGLTILSQYIAGVEPGEAGYESVRLTPRSGDLNAFQCVVPTVQGPMTVSFSGEEHWSYQVELPEGMPTERIRIPWKSGQRILLNGELVYDEGGFRSIPGVGLVADIEGYVFFQTSHDEQHWEVR